MKMLNLKPHRGTLTAIPFVVATLAGCTGHVLDYRNAQIVNGKVYAGDADKPFSGKFTNVPTYKLFPQQAGFESLSTAIVNMRVLTAAPDQAAQSFLGAGNTFLLSLIPSTVCDVGIDDGLPDGDAICAVPNSGTKRIEARFKNGVLDGKFHLYIGANAQLVVDVTFNNGQPDGKLEIHSPSNGKLVHVANWQDGGLSGDEEAFDPNTGNRVLSATLVDGRYDGMLIRYAPDGKTVIFQGSYSNGELSGEVQRFDPQTGIKEVTHVENGKLNGLAQAWDANGKLLGEKTYLDGEDTAVRQKRDEKARLSDEVQVAINDPDPKVAACVKSFPWTEATSMDDGEQMTYDRKIIAWRDDCRANPNSHPAVQN